MEFMSPFGMFSPLGPMLSAPLLPSTRSVGYVPGVRLGANVNDLGWVRDLRRIAAGGGRGVCLLVVVVVVVVVGVGGRSYSPSCRDERRRRAYVLTGAMGCSRVVYVVCVCVMWLCQSRPFVRCSLFVDEEGRRRRR